MTNGASEPTLRQVETNGISLRIAEMGSGPLVVLMHGWPESWYSWRHQIPALAEAGYHVVAPDPRGYGAATRPPPSMTTTSTTTSPTSAGCSMPSARSAR